MPGQSALTGAFSRTDQRQPLAAMSLKRMRCRRAAGAGSKPAAKTPFGVFSFLLQSSFARVSVFQL